MLEIDQISKAFDGVQAVDQATMGFDEGKITALIGPNGAGKTTVFNIVNGFLSPDEGEVYYKGDDLVGLKPWNIAQKGIGRLFQDIHLFDQMTVEENVRSAFPDQEGENVLRSVFNRRSVMEQERELTERTRELLQFVNLEEKATELAKDLSFGQQKLVAIARLLAADADVLLLDEPTAGVNPGLIDPLLDTIENLASEGKIVVVIEHNMDVVLEISDWAYFMDDGKVTSFGLPQDVLGDPEVRRAYMGLGKEVVNA